MTGLIFARFARPRAMLVFARHPVIGQHEGKTTLMLRFANARHNTIGNAAARLWLSRTQTTAEGKTFRRVYDLPLARAETPALMFSWTIFHVIDAASPLNGLTPEDLAASAATIMLSVGGRDENFAQDVSARISYAAADLRWGHRYQDILSVRDDGQTVMDHRLLHDVVAETG
jgi:inward rectifier potassium channel